jgi:hypothetical protein
MLAGRIDVATARYHVMLALERIGRQNVRSLSSGASIDLLLKTKLALARNAKRAVADLSPAATSVFPAYELARIGLRAVPRGTPGSGTVGWEIRWKDAGEEVRWQGASRERMIALKTSPVWAALGDGAGGYEDALGFPYPPFASGSAMDWRAVNRSECVELGLVTTGKYEGLRFYELPPDIQEKLRERWSN